MRETNSVGIILRPVISMDKAFLFNLFVSSRPDLNWITGINEDEKMKIVCQQFKSEQHQIFEEYPEIEANIVLLDEEPIGRLYVDNGIKSFHIIAIAILPEYRSRGIGTKLINDLLIRASHEGRSVSLKVTWFNYPARSLYERLGFSVIEDAGVYCKMQWIPHLQ